MVRVYFTPYFHSIFRNKIHYILAAISVNIGDKVVLHWKKGTGIEANTPKYKWQGKLLNAGWVTTFNNYAVVSENRLTHLPTGINLKDAALC